MRKVFYLTILFNFYCGQASAVPVVEFLDNRLDIEVFATYVNPLNQNVVLDQPP